jgi:hypothetical protein
VAEDVQNSNEIERVLMVLKQDFRSFGVIPRDHAGVLSLVSWLPVCFVIKG